jgi:hypothetical protein
VRDLIWTFYRDLKAYRCAPTKQRNAALRARFDRIFKRKTGFVTLDRLLVRLNANKSELLMVLDRPEIPLHTNGSENDIRCHARLVPAPAATSVVTAAMPSSASPKPAPQARNRILGLPWRSTRRPSHRGRSTPARNHSRQSPVTLTATAFAPLTEIPANLLNGLRSTFRTFSGCTLIDSANYLDFDSAIRRFESSRPSQRR